MYTACQVVIFVYDKNDRVTFFCFLELQSFVLGSTVYASTDCCCSIVISISTFAVVSRFRSHHQYGYLEFCHDVI
jgi:hypothetical protein